MRRIKSNELRNMITLITQFMNDRSLSKKTFAQLVEIFNKCCQNFIPDLSNDLRVLEYVREMKHRNWQCPIVFTVQDGEVIDGIHRGIAYLKCVDDGMNENDLPEIFVDEI